MKISLTLRAFTAAAALVLGGFLALSNLHLGAALVLAVPFILEIAFRKAELAVTLKHYRAATPGARMRLVFVLASTFLLLDAVVSMFMGWNGAVGIVLVFAALPVVSLPLAELFAERRTPKA